MVCLTLESPGLDPCRHLRFNVIMAVNMSIMVFWVVTLRNLTGAYHLFGRMCYFHLQSWPS
jgi:hypothetical protein